MLARGIAIWGRAGTKLGPTPACAEPQPLTLKPGPDWPTYAPFALPKGLGTFLGFSAVFGSKIGGFGGTRTCGQNGPRRAPMAPYRAEVGRVEALDGSNRAPNCPKMPREPSQGVPVSFLGTTVLDQFWAQKEVRIVFWDVRVAWSWWCRLFLLCGEGV